MENVENQISINDMFMGMFDTLTDIKRVMINLGMRNAELEEELKKFKKDVDEPTDVPQ